MGRFPVAIAGALAAALGLNLGILIGAVAGAWGQTAPQMIYGTAGGSIDLFTPQAVVEAGGASIGETAYQFFEQEDLAVTAATSETIAASGDGYMQTWLAETTYSEGLIVGPFHTQYEGEVDIVLAASQTLALTITTVHTFGDGRKLSSSRTERFRVNANDALTLPLEAYSSITDLQLGSVTGDDGQPLAITAALLAAPVKIELVAEFTVEVNGVRKAGTINSLSGNRPKVTFWQLERVHGGNGAQLSDRIPDVDSGTGSAGSGSQASRDDHVHPIPPGIAANAVDIHTVETRLESAIPRLVPLPGTSNNGDVLTRDSTIQGADWGWKPLPFSDATPAVESGSGAAGSATTLSRADHVHPAAGGGGGGNGPPLSDASPKNIGATSAGTGTDASRADHVHALDYRTTAPPVASGSGNPGTAANAARGDHYHPIPPQIAANKAAAASAEAQGTTNRDNIQTNAGAITALGTRATSLEAVRNPALAAGTAGYLVRQKSDHTVYETVEPHAAVLSGLPAITGQGGNALFVNAGATGLEWKAAGGGSGGGGGLAFSEIFEHTLTSATGNQYISKSGASVGKACLDAPMVAFTIDGGSTAKRWSVGPSKLLGSDIETSVAPAIGENVQNGLKWASFKCQNDSGGRYATVNFGLASGLSVTGTLTMWAVVGGGGGGGGDNPTIPDPTSSGAGQFLRVNAAGAAYELAAVTQGHPFGVVGDVASLKTGTAAAGTSARVARADHAHNFPSTLYGTPVAIGTANGAGTATTLARSDHVHSPGNSVATRDQLDAVQDQTDALNRLTVDLILGTPGPLTWADVNGDGSEGGVARGATAGETLDNAAGLTYAAPEQTGNSTFMVVRIPATADPRNYRTVDASEIVLTHSLNIERLIGTKGNWAYYEFPSRLASTETLTLQISGHKIGATTFDGKLGPTAAASIKGHAVKLWTHTATATQWANSNGPALASGVNRAIWAGFSGDAADAWDRLELEVKHTVSGSPGTDYYGLIPLGTWREAGETADNKIRIEGGGFFFGSQLRAIIHLPQPTSFNSTVGNLSIGNCSGCQGNEELEVVLWGVK